MLAAMLFCRVLALPRVVGVNFALPLWVVTFHDQGTSNFVETSYQHQSANRRLLLKQCTVAGSKADNVEVTIFRQNVQELSESFFRAVHVDPIHAP